MPDVPATLTPLEAFRIATSILMVILGPLIFLRAAQVGLTLPAILLSGGLLALGLYRLFFVARWLRARGRNP